MSEQGDLHNFGQRVQRSFGASGAWYRKPRPVYWEWLFFGRSSPLRPYLSARGLSGFCPAEYLFNLEVDIGADYSGTSCEISREAEVVPGPHHAYGFGVLLAYCYTFGIRDLHRDNVCLTGRCLQVIDTEAVLVDLLLPNETLLIPFKATRWDMAAISHLASTGSDLAPEVLRMILTGYCEAFSMLIENAEALKTLVHELKATIERVPVRHIMRDTVIYRDWGKQVPAIPFCEAELEQLARGDVPYFFKFVGDRGLYHYVAPDGTFRPLNPPEQFQPAVARDAVSPEILLDRSRLESRLFPTGILFLLKHLTQSGATGSDFFNLVRTSVSKSFVEVEVAGKRFQAARP